MAEAKKPSPVVTKSTTGKSSKRSPAAAKATSGKSSAKKVVKTKRQLKLPRFLVVLLAPFRGAGRYVKGAWRELRQVRWPNRKATWSLTGAVIIFSIFFAAVILGLDYVFNYLFKEILL